MYQKEFLKTIYVSLPDEISDAVASEETLNSLLKMGDEYQLNKEQRDFVLLETTMRMIGLTPKNKFQEKLEGELKVNSEIANKIANNIIAVVLSKIPEKVLVAQEEYAQVKLKEWQSKPQTIEQKVPENQDLESLPQIKTTELEVPPANLPMVEHGETVHDTKPVDSFVPPKPFIPPQTEKPASAPLTQTPVQNQEPKPATPPPAPQIKPSSGYNGRDPYREPLE